MEKNDPRFQGNWCGRYGPEDNENNKELNIDPFSDVQSSDKRGGQNNEVYTPGPTAPSHQLYYEQQAAGLFQQDQMQNGVTPDRKIAATLDLVRIKKAILIITMCSAVLLLVSIVALILGGLSIASLSQLQAKVNAPVDLYSGCYKDTVTCRVAQHSTNRYWYVCNTPFLTVNKTGFYTVSMQCLRDPDRLYIDTAFVEISNAHARCHCHVLGLTTNGSHAGTFRRIPTGDCHFSMTRCPTSQAIFMGV